MKKIFMLVLGLLIICISANASHSAQYWAKTYGGSEYDYARSIEQTTDGGYILAGETRSFGVGSYDLWLLRLDINGNISWQKTYGGSGIDTANSIQQTLDGGYIVAGFFGGSDWVLKLDSTGGVLWQKTYGGIGAEYAQQTIDGGYIVAGGRNRLGGTGDSDVWVFNLDSNGSILWQKTYGGNESDWAESIQLTIDGGYIVGCNTHSFGVGDRDFLVLKLDNDGNVSWQKTYGGSDLDWFYSLQQTSDGGYILVGETWSFGLPNESDMWVLKLDSTGGISWQKRYGSIEFDTASAIKQTEDGGYIVSGYTNSFGDDNNLWVLKLDSTGGISWQKTYGNGLALSINQTGDGEYFVVGSTYVGYNNTDLKVLKLDSSGDIPNCDIISTSNSASVGTSVISQNSSVTIQSHNTFFNDTSINPQNASAKLTVVCCYDIDDSDGDGVVDACDNCPYDYNSNQDDLDEDGVGNVCDDCPNDPENDIDNDNVCGDIDNCPETPNGPNGGTCIAGVRCKYGRPCMSDIDCGTNGLCSMEQEDLFPPEGNGIGDACELCIADFECDGDVDAEDVTTFLTDFGRNEYNEPCENEPVCKGDFLCDGDVDATDVTKFLEDFGRNQYNNQCPACEVGDWCEY